MDFAITITSTQILGFCALVTSVWNVWDRVVKAKKEKDKPTNDLRKQVAEHEEKLTHDKEELEYLKKSMQLTLKCNLVMIEHDISHNGYPELEKAKAELIDFLTEQ